MHDGFRIVATLGAAGLGPSKEYCQNGFYRINEHGQLMSDIPYDHTTAPAPDIRPTRLGLDALLGGPTLSHGVRRVVIDPLEGAGLLNGGRPYGSAPAADVSARLSVREFDRAIAGFDDLTRKCVKSVLSDCQCLGAVN